MHPTDQAVGFSAAAFIAAAMARDWQEVEAIEFLIMPAIFAAAAILISMATRRLVSALRRSRR